MIPNLEQYIQKYQKIEDTLLALEESNTEQTVCSVLELIGNQFIISYLHDIIHLVYFSFVRKGESPKVYLDFLKLLNKRVEEKFQVHYNIMKVFAYFLFTTETSFGNYFLEYMFENELADPIMLKNQKRAYFSHREIDPNLYAYAGINFNEYKDLMRNNWELHKKLIHAGVHCSRIENIIRKDEVEELQEISSQSNFNFDQTLTGCYFDRYSSIYKYNGLSLIQIAAFFGSIKCFKFLLLNNSSLDNLGGYAVLGGNEEIIHLCEQNHVSFEGAYKEAVIFHRNDIFNYLYENKIVELNNITNLGIECIKYHNYAMLPFLEEKGMEINTYYFTQEILKSGNIFLFKHYLEKIQIPDNILKTVVSSGNIEIVKYVLQNKYIQSYINQFKSRKTNAV